MAVIPPTVYLGLCFRLKPDTQVTIAAILSILYAFLMLVVTMSIIGELNVNRHNYADIYVATLFIHEDLFNAALISIFLHHFTSHQHQW